MFQLNVIHFVVADDKAGVADYSSPPPAVTTKHFDEEMKSCNCNTHMSLRTEMPFLISRQHLRCELSLTPASGNFAFKCQPDRYNRHDHLPLRRTQYFQNKDKYDIWRNTTFHQLLNGYEGKSPCSQCYSSDNNVKQLAKLITRRRDRTQRQGGSCNYLRPLINLTGILSTFYFTNKNEVWP